MASRDEKIRLEQNRLTTPALVALISAWCVRHAETRHQFPLWMKEAWIVLSRRLGPLPALAKCRVYAAQLTLTLHGGPDGKH